ncbi:sigma-70 family RNA polymerase sigma factor [Streptomyces sp. NPDC051771]|uniref:RNA polymerase sigma factor n=1 Tax=Streptomyces sp. NPDC051771 TaxID=3154847 RepID=UPI003431C4BA
MTDGMCPDLYDSDPQSRFTKLRTPLLRAAYAQSSGDLHLAEDAVQITMEKVFKKFIPELEHVSPDRLEAYSRTVLRRVFIDEYRKNSKVALIPVSPEVLPDGISSIGLPEEAYQEVREGIHEVVANLPERQREVVESCVLKDAHPSEVAAKMGVSEETVKRYLRAALTRLEKVMTTASPEEGVSA